MAAASAPPRWCYCLFHRVLTGYSCAGLSDADLSDAGPSAVDLFDVDLSAVGLSDAGPFDADLFDAGRDLRPGECPGSQTCWRAAGSCWSPSCCEQG